MTLPPSIRAVLGAMGAVLLAALLVPSAMQSAWQCTHGRESGCIAPGLPTSDDLAWWAFVVPWPALCMLSRIRGAARFGSPFAAPRSPGWFATVLMAGLCALFAWFKLTDMSVLIVRTPAWDYVAVVVSLLLASYFVGLTTVRTRRELVVAARAAAIDVSHHRRSARLLIGSGLLIYGLALAAIFGDVGLEDHIAPPGSDGPGMLMVALATIWLIGLPFFLLLLRSAATLAGVRPWRTVEPRAATMLVACWLLMWAMHDRTSTITGLVTGCFWVVFAAWLFVLQACCAQAARRLT